MRLRAYLRIFVAATVLTLVATTLAPDVILPFAANPGQTARAAFMTERVFTAISWPPQVVARALGIWIDSHSAQVWPPGWPAFAAFSLRLGAISIPFWFALGAMVFEVSRAAAMLARRRTTSSRPV
jgi:hypothetical protein